MHRRDFIKVGTASTLGILTADAAASGILDLEDTMRTSHNDAPLLKSLKYGMIGQGNTILDKFMLVKACGFDGVEMDAPGNWSIDEVLEAKSTAEIEIPGVVLSTHWQKPFNHPDPRIRSEAKQALEKAITACKQVGGTTVLVVPAVVNEDMSYQSAYELSQKEIGEMVPLAEESGVSIAFENVWNNFLLSPLEAAQYVDSFESAHVGWYFDIGNIVNYGYPAHWIDTLGNRIMKLDVKEFSRKKRNDEGLWKGFSVKIGDGDVGWAAVNDALRRIDYKGWASAEVGGGGKERLIEISQRMDRVFSL